VVVKEGVHTVQCLVVVHTKKNNPLFIGKTKIIVHRLCRIPESVAGVKNAQITNVLNCSINFLAANMAADLVCAQFSRGFSGECEQICDS
jgi:hypothetical protein